MENMQIAPAARWKCTPSAYGTSPGGGGFLSASLSANLSCSLYSAARISPSGGGAAGDRRGAFPTGAARFACFPFAPLARLYGFIQTGAAGAHHNPRAIGTSNFSPLRTFGPKGRQPSRPQGVPRVSRVSTKKAWHLKLRIHAFLISNYFKRIPSAASPRDSSTEGWGRMTLRKSSMVR